MVAATNVISVQLGCIKGKWVYKQNLLISIQTSVQSKGIV
jgi:hypothetical protein